MPEESTTPSLVELGGETNRKLVELAVLKGDSLSVRARLSQQRYQLVKLRDQGKTQKESLNRLLGRDLETEFSVEVQPMPAVDEIDLSAAHRVALSHRPEIQEAQLDVRKAETEVRRERAKSDDESRLDQHQFLIKPPTAFFHFVPVRTFVKAPFAALLMLELFYGVS